MQQAGEGGQAGAVCVGLFFTQCAARSRPFQWMTWLEQSWVAQEKEVYQWLLAIIIHNGTSGHSILLLDAGID